MYFVIGAKGYLGSYFIKNILAQTGEEIVAVARSFPSAQNKRVHWVSCDVTNPTDVDNLETEWFSTGEKNKVIYLAAYHNPDMVEINPKLAWDVNVTALSRFLNTVEPVHRFYYLSSDSVYGENVNMEPFGEDAVLHPVNRYGMQKSVAEKLVTGYGYHVARYPFLFGPSLLEHKNHFYDVIVETLQRGESFYLFHDSYRSTLSFDKAATLVIKLMERSETPPPILNVCGDDALSKYDVGLILAQKHGFSTDLICPISIHHNVDVFDVKRASSTVMSNLALKKVLGEQEIKFTL